MSSNLTPSASKNVGTKTKLELAPAETLVDEAPANLQNNAALFDNPKRSGGRVKVCVTDWNGDGRPDLLVGDFASGGNRQYHGWVWVYLRKPSP